MKSASVATLLAFAASTVVSAQTTSLVILGFDPQPLSADVIGVDTAAEHTTYAVQAGKDPNWQDGFLPGTATVVQGSDYASLLYVLSDGSTTKTLAYGCTFQGDQEICTGAFDGQTVTETDTRQSAIPVALGTAVIPGAASPSVTPTGASPASSGGLSSTTSASSRSEAPSPTQSSGAISLNSAWSAAVALLAVGFTMIV
ncbi:hypothetical protein P691DRAFT_770796 [Macrolepiota fuliginosa MF-IS2]|uniref:Uncharacterized protein n=1 Tax=Macrolepiota fuliginosa MF-IS2 TaxID=1400762 RepID=A0A9P6C9K2_9AGAR|nr:hypothetical protein P691DRAFT_770796 [Macrolepiota fuliginosa MF-IS2]